MKETSSAQQCTSAGIHVFQHSVHTTIASSQLHPILRRNAWQMHHHEASTYMPTRASCPHVRDSNWPPDPGLPDLASSTCPAKLSTSRSVQQLSIYRSPPTTPRSQWRGCTASNPAQRYGNRSWKGFWSNQAMRFMQAGKADKTTSSYCRFLSCHDTCTGACRHGPCRTSPPSQHGRGILHSWPDG